VTPYTHGKGLNQTGTKPGREPQQKFKKRGTTIKKTKLETLQANKRELGADGIGLRITSSPTPEWSARGPAMGVGKSRSGGP